MSNALDLPTGPIAPPARVAELLRGAAAHLDAVGLHKGSLYGPDPGGYLWITSHSPEAATVSCCAHGAIAVLSRNNNHGLPEHVAGLVFDRYVGVHHADELATLRGAVDDDGEPTEAAWRAQTTREGAAWNDAPDRTKEDVVAALRAAADAHEAGEL